VVECVNCREEKWIHDVNEVRNIKKNDGWVCATCAPEIEFQKRIGLAFQYYKSRDEIIQPVLFSKAYELYIPTINVEYGRAV
jgi:protein-arginine kinase activator protein McsA